LFGVLLMPLEDFEAGLQQALELLLADGMSVVASAPLTVL
jgi:hypothetical protein